MKKHYPKNDIFYLVTSGSYSIRLTANRRAQIDSRDPGLSFDYLAILVACIVFLDIAIVCENSPIFIIFFDPL